MKRLSTNNHLIDLRNVLLILCALELTITFFTKGLPLYSAYIIMSRVFYKTMFLYGIYYVVTRRSFT